MSLGGLYGCARMAGATALQSKQCRVAGRNSCAGGRKTLIGRLLKGRPCAADWRPGLAGVSVMVGVHLVLAVIGKPGEWYNKWTEQTQTTPLIKAKLESTRHTKCLNPHKP